MRVVAWPAFNNKTINPYQHLLYSHMPEGTMVRDKNWGDILKGRFDVFHFHWPDEYIAKPGAFQALKRIVTLFGVVGLIKLRGKKMIWTVHNIKPHQSYHAKLESFCLKMFVVCCNGLIYLSESSRASAQNHFQGWIQCKSAVIPHGHYRGYFGESPTQADARRKLGLDANKRVLMFFGQIKPYKNVLGLIEEFVKRGGDDVLLIVGSADAEMTKRLNFAAKGSAKIKLDLSFVPDSKLPAYFAACDLVVLPFHKILNSGSAVMALSLNKPVMVPNLGSLKELQKLTNDKWVRIYEGPFTHEALDKALIELPASNEICDLTPLNWDKLAAETRHFYGQL